MSGRRWAKASKVTDECPRCGELIESVVFDQPSLLDGPTVRAVLRVCHCGWRSRVRRSTLEPECGEVKP